MQKAIISLRVWLLSLIPLKLTSNLLNKSIMRAEGVLMPGSGTLLVAQGKSAVGSEAESPIARKTAAREVQCC
jgi:hypothetical protein